MAHYDFKRKGLPLFISFIVFTTMSISLQNANAGWVSCKKKNNLLGLAAKCGWVGGVVGFCGELAVGISGGSPAEMVSVGLGSIGSLGVAYFASEATKPPAPIFDIKAAVMDDSSPGFSELVMRVQNEIVDAPAKEIWDLLQTLDDKGKLCSRFGKYHNMEKVVTIMTTRLAPNSAAGAPSETASEADDFDSVVEIELEDLPAVSNLQQY